MHPASAELQKTLKLFVLTLTVIYNELSKINSMHMQSLIQITALLQCNCTAKKYISCMSCTLSLLMHCIIKQRHIGTMQILLHCIIKQRCVCTVQVLV